jgi:hypothetical protein
MALLQFLLDLIAKLPPGDQVFEFYQKHLRGSLFSGFLTLSGFLFSVNTFIVVNMKKELYDQPGYLERFEKQLAYDTNRTLYGPLQRLSKLMLIAVSTAVMTSVTQFTVGLVPRWYTAVACVLMACVAVFFLAKVLWVIRQNLREMFEYLEKDAADKLKKRKQAVVTEQAA